VIFLRRGVPPESSQGTRIHRVSGVVGLVSAARFSAAGRPAEAAAYAVTNFVTVDVVGARS